MAGDLWQPLRTEDDQCEDQEQRELLNPDVEHCRVRGSVAIDLPAAPAVLFALSLPIAYHCITAYGVQTYSARVALHSLAGCFFYGAFAAKVLLVRSRPT